jgi:hypothetical protein
MTKSSPTQKVAVITGSFQEWKQFCKIKMEDAGPFQRVVSRDQFGRLQIGSIEYLLCNQIDKCRGIEFKRIETFGNWYETHSQESYEYLLTRINRN